MCKFKSNWMTCTSCRAVVQRNDTGICLGCQGGFSGAKEEEKCHVPIETSYKKPDANMRQQNNDATLRQEEKEDAIKEGEIKESDLREHQNGDGCGKTTETGSGDSTECSGKESQKKKKWWKKEE
jgi:hypothetical protein